MRKNIKKIVSAMLVSLIVLAQSTIAYATFYEVGDYSELGTTDGYGFKMETRDALLVYGNENFWYPYDGVWPGSVLYIPVFSEDTGDVATMSEIKNCAVGITYKSSSEVVKRADIVEVNGQFDELENGAYVKISFVDEYDDSDGKGFTLRLVLTVNGKSQQTTFTALQDKFRNRTEDLHKNSVYSAKMPTVFRTDKYSGDATFDFGGNIRYTTTVDKNKRYYLNLDKEPVESIKNNYKKVHIEYYFFKGNEKTFASTGTLEIPVNTNDFKAKKTSSPSIYPYKYSNGVLTSIPSSEISFNSKRDVIVIKAKTLENYILSAQPLLHEISDDTEILKTGYETPIKEPSVSSQTASQAAPSQSQQTAPPSSAANYNQVDNPNTGGDGIEAYNASTHNPSTSDSRPSIAVITCVMAMSAAALVVLKRAEKSKG